MRVRPTDSERVPTTSEKLSDDDAVSALLRGSAVLEEEQADPPFAALERLETLAIPGPNFGPEMNSRKLIEKIRTTIFANNVRQRIVEGDPIHWYPAGGEAVRAAGALLTPTLPIGGDLFSQISRVLRIYLHSSETVELFKALSPDEQRSRYLIPSSSGSIPGVRYRYTSLSPGWYEFNKRYGSLSNRIVERIENAFSKGSVVCGEELGSTVSMLHPNQARSVKPYRREPQRYFFFTRDLPGSWVFGDLSLPQRKSLAGAWMLRVFRHFEAEGRRPTKKQLVTVAHRKFGISVNAAEDVWADVKEEMGGPKYNMKDHIRVNINEIRQIE